MPFSLGMQPPHPLRRSGARQLRAAFLAAALLAAFATAPARAGEGYIYSSSQAFSTSFSLIGGHYIFYVDAHLPPMWAFNLYQLN